MSEKCDLNDPRRCIGVSAKGQCDYLAIEGSRYCDFHQQLGHKKETQKAIDQFLIEREELRNPYQRFSRESNYLDMRQTIGLLKMMIERRLNHAKNENDEIASFRDVESYIAKLTSMAIALQKLQEQMGLVLGKDELRHFAKDIGTILNEELEGVDGKEAKIDAICERIFESLDNTQGTKHE